MQRKNWSIILVDKTSVERYRAVHLGRRGPPSERCLTCGRKPGRHPRAHSYERDPRLDQ